MVKVLPYLGGCVLSMGHRVKRDQQFMLPGKRRFFQEQWLQLQSFKWIEFLELKSIMERDF